MKSLLVANALYTTASKKPSEVTKGYLAIIDGATGLTVTKLSSVTGSVYKFVVGLGDGKWIDGVWLNSKNDVVGTQVTPSAGTAKILTIDNFSLLPLSEGQDAELHISVDAKNSFTGDGKTLYVASVTVDSTSQTLDVIKEALFVEATKVATKLTALYGKTFTLAKIATEGATGWTFTCADANIDFNISVGGCLKATVVANANRALPQGQGYQIVEMEKELAIATAGYNPNFDDASKAYGDIFVADKSETYYTNVITSVAPHTDQMPLHEQGAEVIQHLACKVSMSNFLA